ncbi:hypothetical protein MRX96_023486 [Rhipicephalus microplus]
MAAKVMRFNVAEKTMTFPTNATTDSFTRQQLESGGREFLDDVLNRDLGFMRGIPNTIQYWQERRKELFAMIRQLGRPHVFLTLSASELHWDRLLETLERLRVGPEGRSRVAGVTSPVNTIEGTGYGKSGKPLRCCFWPSQIRQHFDNLDYAK